MSMDIEKKITLELILMWSIFGFIALFQSRDDYDETAFYEQIKHLSEQLDAVYLHPNDEISRIADSIRDMRDLLQYGDDNLRRLGDFGLKRLYAQAAKAVNHEG